METEQPAPKLTSKSWRFWRIYRLLVAGLWLAQFALFVPHILDIVEIYWRGWNNNMGLEVLLMLDLGVLIVSLFVLLSSFIMAFPGALAIWAIAKIGK